LSEDNLNRLLSDANDPKVVRRLVFVKNQCKSDSPEEAIDRVGKSEPAVSQWASRWNEGGLAQLTLKFGGRMSSKFGEDEQEQPLEVLHDCQPWQPQEIQYLISDEFG
jgi:transposase